MMINGIPMDTDGAVPTIVRLLQGYADALGPWAEAVANRMLTEVNAQDFASWRRMSEELSEELKREIATTPTGEVTRELLDANVKLIKSIPLEAAERVQALALKAVEEGGRTPAIIEEIMRSGQVSVGRARTIARTETARAASSFTQARAKNVGSDGYVWRTSKDGDVRDSHKHMSGKFVAWSDPPTLDGLTGHAGCLPNCRCWPEPILKD